MAFSNKAQQSDVRQSLPPITGIYPTMNMMLGAFHYFYNYNFNSILCRICYHNNSFLAGYPAARQVGPRPSHFNQNYHKNNRAPR